MGTFQGHALPGAFFILFSLWWTTQATQRWCVCRAYRMQYHATLTFPVFRRQRVYPRVEPLVKIVSCSIGMSLELLAAYDYGRSTHTPWYGDLQHLTMYMYFLLSGATDIATIKYRALPRGLDHVVFALAFVNEAYLFAFHLHGRGHVDAAVHEVLLLAVWGCAALVMVELAYSAAYEVTLLRAYCTLLQGTLFIQIGFILYNPLPGRGPWEDNADNLLLAMCWLCWHCVGDVIVVVVVVYVTQVYCSKHARYKITDVQYLYVRDYNRCKTLQNVTQRGEDTVFCDSDSLEVEDEL